MLNFSYKDNCPLPARNPAGPVHLRFLRLLRGSGLSPVESELFVSEEKKEDYEALSWCWGGQSPTLPIKIIDGAGEPTLTFKIPANLEAALRVSSKSASL